MHCFHKTLCPDKETLKQVFSEDGFETSRRIVERNKLSPHLMVNRAKMMRKIFGDQFVEFTKSSADIMISNLPLKIALPSFVNINMKTFDIHLTDDKVAHYINSHSALTNPTLLNILEECDVQRAKQFLEESNPDDRSSISSITSDDSIMTHDSIEEFIPNYSMQQGMKKARELEERVRMKLKGLSEESIEEYTSALNLDETVSCYSVESIKRAILKFKKDEKPPFLKPNSRRFREITSQPPEMTERYRSRCEATLNKKCTLFQPGVFTSMMSFKTRTSMVSFGESERIDPTIQLTIAEFLAFLSLTEPVGSWECDIMTLESLFIHNNSRFLFLKELFDFPVGSYQEFCNLLEKINESVNGGNHGQISSTERSLFDHCLSDLFIQIQVSVINLYCSIALKSPSNFYVPSGVAGDPGTAIKINLLTKNPKFSDSFFLTMMTRDPALPKLISKVGITSSKIQIRDRYSEDTTLIANSVKILTESLIQISTVLDEALIPSTGAASALRFLNEESNRILKDRKALRTISIGSMVNRTASLVRHGDFSHTEKISQSCRVITAILDSYGMPSSDNLSEVLSTLTLVVPKLVDDPIHSKQTLSEIISNLQSRTSDFDAALNTAIENLYKALMTTPCANIVSDLKIMSQKKQQFNQKYQVLTRLSGRINEELMRVFLNLVQPSDRSTVSEALQEIHRQHFDGPNFSYPDILNHELSNTPDFWFFCEMDDLNSSGLFSNELESPEQLFSLIDPLYFTEKHNMEPKTNKCAIKLPDNFGMIKTLKKIKKIESIYDLNMLDQPVLVLLECGFARPSKINEKQGLDLKKYPYLSMWSSKLFPTVVISVLNQNSALRSFGPAYDTYTNSLMLVSETFSLIKSTSPNSCPVIETKLKHSTMARSTIPNPKHTNLYSKLFEIKWETPTGQIQIVPSVLSPIISKIVSRYPRNERLLDEYSSELFCKDFVRTFQLHYKKMPDTNGPFGPLYINDDRSVMHLRFLEGVVSGLKSTCSVKDKKEVNSKHLLSSPYFRVVGKENSSCSVPDSLSNWVHHNKLKEDSIPKCQIVDRETLKSNIVLSSLIHTKLNDLSTTTRPEKKLEKFPRRVKRTRVMQSKKMQAVNLMTGLIFNLFPSNRLFLFDTNGQILKKKQFTLSSITSLIASCGIKTESFFKNPDRIVNAPSITDWILSEIHSKYSEVKDDLNKVLDECMGDIKTKENSTLCEVPVDKHLPSIQLSCEKDVLFWKNWMVFLLHNLLVNGIHNFLNGLDHVDLSIRMELEKDPLTHLTRRLEQHQHKEKESRHYLLDDYRKVLETNLPNHNRSQLDRQTAVRFIEDFKRLNVSHGPANLCQEMTFYITLLEKIVLKTGLLDKPAHMSKIASELQKLSGIKSEKLSHVHHIPLSDFQTLIVKIPKTRVKNFEFVVVTQTVSGKVLTDRTTIMEDQLIPLMNAPYFLLFSAFQIIQGVLSEEPQSSLTLIEEIESLEALSKDNSLSSLMMEMSVVMCNIISDLTSLFSSGVSGTASSQEICKTLSDEINVRVESLKMVSLERSSRSQLDEIMRSVCYYSLVTLPAQVKNDQKHNVSLQNTRFVLMESLCEQGDPFLIASKFTDISGSQECNLHIILNLCISVYNYRHNGTMVEPVLDGFPESPNFLNSCTLEQCKTPDQFMNSIYALHLYTRGLMSDISSSNVHNAFFKTPTKFNERISNVIKCMDHCLNRFDVIRSTSGIKRNELCISCRPQFDEYVRLTQIPLYEFKDLTELRNFVISSLVCSWEKNIKITYGCPYVQQVVGKIARTTYTTSELLECSQEDDLRHLSRSEFMVSTSVIQKAEEFFNPVKSFHENQRTVYSKLLLEHNINPATVSHEDYINLSSKLNNSKVEAEKFLKEIFNKAKGSVKVNSTENTTTTYSGMLETASGRPVALSLISKGIFNQVEIGKVVEVDHMKSSMYQNFMSALFLLSEGTNVTLYSERISKINEMISEMKENPRKNHTSERLVVDKRTLNRLKEVEEEKLSQSMCSKSGSGPLQKILSELRSEIMDRYNYEPKQFFDIPGLTDSLTKELNVSQNLIDEFEDSEMENLEDVLNYIENNFESGPKLINHWKKMKHSLIEFEGINDEGRGVFKGVELGGDYSSEYITSIRRINSYLEEFQKLPESSLDEALKQSKQQYIIRELNSQSKFVSSQFKLDLLKSYCSVVKHCILNIPTICFHNCYECNTEMFENSKLSTILYKMLPNEARLGCLILLTGEELGSKVYISKNLTVENATETLLFRLSAPKIIDETGFRINITHSIVDMMFGSLSKATRVSQTKFFSALTRTSCYDLKSARVSFELSKDINESKEGLIWNKVSKILSDDDFRVREKISPKAQFGSDRDLVVQTLDTKELMGLMERISKKYLSKSTNDLLVHPEKKRMIIKSMQEQFIEKSSSLAHMNLACANSDETQWGPTHSAMGFLNTLLPIMEDNQNFANILSHACVLNCAKRILVDPGLLTKIMSFLDKHQIMIIHNASKDKYNFLKNGIEISVQEVVDKVNKMNDNCGPILLNCIQKGRSFMNSFTHMGQGIFHATSSLAADCFVRTSSVIRDYCRRLPVNSPMRIPNDFHYLTIRSSDDSFTHSTCPSQKQKEFSETFYQLYAMETAIQYMLNIRKSSKHTASSNALVAEVYSTFTTAKPMVPTIKELAALITMPPSSTLLGDALTRFNLAKSCFTQGACLIEIVFSMLLGVCKQMRFLPHGSTMRQFSQSYPMCLTGVPEVSLRSILQDPFSHELNKITTALESLIFKKEEEARRRREKKEKRQYEGETEDAVSDDRIVDEVESDQETENTTTLSNAICVSLKPGEYTYKPKSSAVKKVTLKDSGIYSDIQVTPIDSRSTARFDEIRTTLLAELQRSNVETKLLELAFDSRQASSQETTLIKAAQSVKNQDPNAQRSLNPGNSINQSIHGQRGFFFHLDPYIKSPTMTTTSGTKVTSGKSCTSWEVDVSNEPDITELQSKLEYYGTIKKLQGNESLDSIGICSSIKLTSDGPMSSYTLKKWVRVLESSSVSGVARPYSEIVGVCVDRDMMLSNNLHIEQHVLNACFRELNIIDPKLISLIVHLNMVYHNTELVVLPGQIINWVETNPQETKNSVLNSITEGLSDVKSLLNISGLSDDLDGAMKLVKQFSDKLKGCTVKETEFLLTQPENEKIHELESLERFGQSKVFEYCKSGPQTTNFGPNKTKLKVSNLEQQLKTLISVTNFVDPSSNSYDQLMQECIDIMNDIKLTDKSLTYLSKQLKSFVTEEPLVMELTAESIDGINISHSKRGQITEVHYQSSTTIAKAASKDFKNDQIVLSLSTLVEPTKVLNRVLDYISEQFSTNPLSLVSRLPTYYFHKGKPSRLIPVIDSKQSISVQSGFIPFNSTKPYISLIPTLESDFYGPPKIQHSFKNHHVAKNRLVKVIRTEYRSLVHKKTTQYTIEEMDGGTAATNISQKFYLGSTRSPYKCLEWISEKFRRIEFSERTPNYFPLMNSKETQIRSWNDMKESLMDSLASVVEEGNNLVIQRQSSEQLQSKVTPLLQCIHNARTSFGFQYETLSTGYLTITSDTEKLNSILESQCPIESVLTILKDMTTDVVQMTNLENKVNLSKPLYDIVHIDSELRIKLTLPMSMAKGLLASFDNCEIADLSKSTTALTNSGPGTTKRQAKEISSLLEGFFRDSLNLNYKSVRRATRADRVVGLVYEFVYPKSELDCLSLSLLAGVISTYSTSRNSINPEICCALRTVIAMVTKSQERICCIFRTNDKTEEDSESVEIQSFSSASEYRDNYQDLVSDDEFDVDPMDLI